MAEKSKVSELMTQKLQQAMAEGRIKGFKPRKVQLGIRLGVEYVVALDVLAELLGESRTGLAHDLLRAAIVDAGRGLNIADVGSPEWSKDFGDRLRALLQEQDEQEPFDPEDLPLPDEGSGA